MLLDLVKAFDKAIRQIVYGCNPQHLHLTAAQKADLMVSFGVDPASAQWIVRYIDEAGCVMERWKADPKATEMAESLHANAWFTASDEAPAVTTATGGRQGCKLGALTFNSHYAVALDAITQRLAGEGIALRMVVPSGPFWHPESGADDMEDILDAAFVDDEAMAFIAASPRLLDRAMSVLLQTVTSVFQALHLEINWSEGKTECILKYRGKNAVRHREQWRQPDGKLRIPISGRADCMLSIVQEYRHLGTYVVASPHGDTHKTQPTESPRRWRRTLLSPPRSSAQQGCL